MSNQLDLFAHVACAYAETLSGRLDNADLYSRVAQRAGLAERELNAVVPIGASGQQHSPLKRKIRWFQQDLRRMGVLERVDGARGLWALTEDAGKRLQKMRSGVKLLAFSTTLGVAILGSCDEVFGDSRTPITLCVTSPPYLLAKPRDYGNPGTEREYIDFICKSLEPIVRNLVPGGSICLNISNDVFERGVPARSLYCERLVLALVERFSLFLMDRLVWENPSKPPTPVQWASIKRVQLNSGYEHIYWFCNDPNKVKADNRRVLEAHTERHMALMARGGEDRSTNYGDGAHRLREGSFGRVTSGRIPRNVIRRGHNCADNREYRLGASALGLPLHGAVQPISIPEFLIKLLTEEGDVVAEPFYGKGTTAMAAERLNRRWIATELMLEYMRGSAERFRRCDGFWMNPALEGVGGSYQ